MQRDLQATSLMFKSTIWMRLTTSYHYQSDAIVSRIKEFLENNWGFKNPLRLMIIIESNDLMNNSYILLRHAHSRFSRMILIELFCQKKDFHLLIS